ncbi:MAG: hypothetical protein EOM19_04405 [Candidatus Moranbacteria bacterium]|nr:hypothetical protein [Candidatus Moranbacteria bacterium]
MTKKKSDDVGEGRFSTQLQEAIQIPNKKKTCMRSQKTPSRIVFDRGLITALLFKEGNFTQEYHRIEGGIVSMRGV